LVALQLCLGTNAKTTNHSRNLSDLIFCDGSITPSKSAVIRVTLLNNENDGYMCDVYRNKITVERVVAVTGSDGKGNSISKNDLNKMLEKL
jgi:chromosome segregation ATPase